MYVLHAWLQRTPSVLVWSDSVKPKFCGSAHKIKRDA